MTTDTVPEHLAAVPVRRVTATHFRVLDILVEIADEIADEIDDRDDAVRTLAIARSEAALATAPRFLAMHIADLASILTALQRVTSETGAGLNPERLADAIAAACGQS